MQQATPAPTERSSPYPQVDSGRSHDNVVAAEDHPITYPDPPRNADSAPFFVLSMLFDKLQNERKPDKRRKLLETWFNVCYDSLVLCIFVHNCSNTVLLALA